MNSQTSLQLKSEATGKPEVKGISRLRLSLASAYLLLCSTFGLMMKVIGSSEMCVLYI
jgi:hypothetical protein